MRAGALAATAIAAGALALELRGAGGGPAAAGFAPDLLLVAAVALAARPAGRGIAAAAALGAARDAIAGGPAGTFASGFLLGALFARAALGRARRAGVLAAAAAVLAGGVVAYGAAAVPTAFGDRALARPLLLDAVRTALASALFSPALLVPLAALERPGGAADRFDLAARVAP